MATAVRTSAVKSPARCGCSAPLQVERATPTRRAMTAAPLPAFEFGGMMVDAPKLPDAVMQAAAGWLPEPQDAQRRPPRQDDAQQDEQTGQTEDDGAVPPDQCACASQDDSEQSAMEHRAPTENGAAPQRPQEAGWFTGDWYKTQNTIICDGSGSLGINEATSYQYGVQDCTRQHESSHRTDWYGRYGNDICKGRAKGDLPNFTPAGKESYGDFLKKSECDAWKIGETCRKAAYAACADDTCKNYVQTFVTQAAAQVKSVLRMNPTPVAGPLRLEGFTPLDRSLEVRISRRYWEMRGSQAFVQREVPSDITNDGVRAGHAAAVLFENCLEADSAGTLGETIDVLEIGVGTGLFARLLLRRFAALCAQHGRDFDSRLRYVATDVSSKALAALQDNGILDGMHHRTCLATLDAMDPSVYTPLDADRARGWERPLQAVFHNYLYDVLPQSLLLRQSGNWFELRVQTWLSDSSRLADVTTRSVEELRHGLREGQPDALNALAQAYRLVEVERGFFPLAGEDIPYRACVERFVTTVLYDDGDEMRLWVPFGAMRSLEQAMPLLAQSGFVLFTDYGAATPAQVTTARTYQRYGAGVCIPLNFPLIDWYAESLGLRCTVPADDELPLHARLLARSALPRTEMRFIERFDAETFRSLERLIDDARTLVGNNIPAARANFRKAAELAPDNWLMLAEWAHMEIEAAGDAQAALQIANRAIEINPACSPDLWCEKGDALHRLGDRAGAADAYQRALAIDPDHPRSHHQCAGLLNERGAFTDALMAIGRAFAGDADGRHTKVLLERQAEILDQRASATQRDIERLRSRQYG